MSKSTRGNSIPVWKPILIMGIAVFSTLTTTNGYAFDSSVCKKSPQAFQACMKNSALGLNPDGSRTVSISPRDELKNQIVGIETPGSSGTGTIIGKKGNIYTILTARHVIPSIQEGDEYYAYSMKSKKRYRITSVQAPLGKKADIAVATFTAPEDFNLNIISDFYPFSDVIQHCTTCPAIQRAPVSRQWKMESTGGRGAGISMPSGAVTVPIYRFTEFVIQERAHGNKDGYELLYAASTVPGMSGGPIIGYREFGKINQGKCDFSGIALLAIHGRSEKYHSGGRSGLSLGVPVNLIKDYLVSNSERLGIPVNQNDIESTLSSQYCS
tara:strand:- start:286 stop:1263 length:978 start_codon:yes stop_codon:yes gene_type:complete